MALLCQNLGERFKQQRIIALSLDSLFQSVLSLKVLSLFLVMVSRSLLVELLTTRSLTDPAGAQIYAPISVKLLGSRAVVFLLPPSSVPALGGDRWYTQNSTNPADTKLTCFWRIPTQQLFAPGGCSTFDPILAGARSDLQCWVLRAVCPELALIMSWAFLLFFLSSFSLLSLVQMYNPLKTMFNELPPLMMLTYGFIGDVCIFWGQRRGSLIVWFPRVQQLILTSIPK